MKLLSDSKKMLILLSMLVLLLGACSFSGDDLPATGTGTAAPITTVPPATEPTTLPSAPSATVPTTTEPTQSEDQTTELSDPVAPTASPASSEDVTTEPTAASDTDASSEQTSVTSAPQTTASSPGTTTPVLTSPVSTTPPTSAVRTTPVPTTPAQTTAMTLEQIGFGETPIVVSKPNTGGEVYGNEGATIDATDKAEGYVLVRYIGGGDARIKVLITGPSGVQYTYNLNNQGSYEVFPFSDGDGSYVIGVYRNTTGSKYSTVYKATVSVTMKNAFAAFLHPNQYVNYSADSQALKIAAQLTAKLSGTLEKVEAVYRYVTENITYDYALAASVQSGYLPDIDAVLAKKTGICFDYAAVMASMLRGLNIPTKLVVGYCGTEYHAWINVYVEGQGWVNSVVFFDGSTWNHMDPTYAASRPEIGDFSSRYTYTAKYIY